MTGQVASPQIVICEQDEAVTVIAVLNAYINAVLRNNPRNFAQLPRPRLCQLSDEWLFNVPDVKTGLRQYLLGFGAIFNKEVGMALLGA
ncbi:hypothetical protein TH60_15005 [Pantoea ananatis]|nr:hypothetical protein [Pantoea ananatis]PKC47967.1 hypothetical protein V461_00175 [Pantoea ananatis BRT98]